MPVEDTEAAAPVAESEAEAPAPVPAVELPRLPTVNDVEVFVTSPPRLFEALW